MKNRIKITTDFEKKSEKERKEFLEQLGNLLAEIHLKTERKGNLTLDRYQLT